MEEKLLSICIPTFNGTQYIDDLLLSLKKAITSLDVAGLEILISDNNTNKQISNDTARAIKSYSLDLPITIIDNPRKELKLDGNLLNLVDKSTGKFLWFICDDDAVSQNAVKEIVSVLNKNEDDLSVLFMNYYETDMHLNIIENPIRPKIEVEGKFSCGDDFLRATDLQFGLVSSLVVNRHDALNCDLESYLGQDSLHMPMVLQLADKHGGYVIKEKLVYMRDNNTRWGESADQIIIISRLFGLFGIMHTLRYQKSTIRWVQSYFFASICKTILRNHVRGRYDKLEVIQNLRKLYWSSPLKLLVLKLMIYTPPKLAQITYKFRGIFK